jgi:hypothetical protein
MSVTGPGHGAWSDAVGAYVLGALPPAECAGFEAHMGECPACRDDVADLQVAADALPASVPPVLPPPELKGRIMAIVESEAALLAAAGERADRPAAAPAPAAAKPERRRWWHGLLTLRPALAAACAAALLLVGGLGGALLSGGSADVRTVTAQVDPAQAPDASVRLEVRDDGGTLAVEGMPPPPKGRVYQVWVKRPGRDPQPTDVLWSPRGDGSAEVAVPGSLDGVEAVLVTDEQQGGADEPSKAPVITAQPA